VNCIQHTWLQAVEPYRAETRYAIIAVAIKQTIQLKFSRQAFFVENSQTAYMYIRAKDHAIHAVKRYFTHAKTFNT